MSSSLENKKVSIEPLCYRLRGFTLDELFSKKFIDELKAVEPNATVGHFVITFSDSAELVSVSHSRKKDVTILDHVDVEGDDQHRIQEVANAIQKVLG